MVQHSRSLSPPRGALVVLPVGLYKILFHFKASLWESILLSSPSQPTTHPIAIYYWTTIAQYAPAHGPPFLCHIPYDIGDGNIV